MPPQAGVWRRNGRTSPRSRWSTVSILLVARWSANGLCSRRARHPAALRIVLGHELFHYAARADTALDAPRWLAEGVADFVARPKTPPPADAVSVALSLPSDTDLDTPGPQRSLAYDRAWWFARFVAAAYGTAKLRELYLATCGVGHFDLATAAHDVLGIDAAGLLARWQRWLMG